jgi:hypothetical protein
MQERRGGELSVADHVIGKPRSQKGDGTAQQTLGSGVLAIAGSIGFDIHRKGKAGSGHTDHHHLMVIAHHFLVLFVNGTAKLAAPGAASSGAGAIHHQSNESAAVEGFVALRLT